MRNLVNSKQKYDYSKDVYLSQCRSQQYSNDPMKTVKIKTLKIGHWKIEMTALRKLVVRQYYLIGKKSSI